MTKRLLLIATIIIIPTMIACSNTDSTMEEDPPSENEESILFSKISYENIIDNTVVALVEFHFEENKVVRQDGFNPNGVLQNYTTYEYGDNGLLQKRTYHNANGSINFINNFNYENNNLVLIEYIQNNANGSETLYDIFTYSDNLIENEFVGPNGNRIALTRYFLNNDGFIYKQDNGTSANGTSVEITLENSLPSSKIVEFPSNTIEFEHEYLDSPVPIGPWKDFWGNFYGSLNNQIIQNGGGLIDYEDTVDLNKYIVRAGSQLQREYEFDSDGLPIRIAKTSSSDFKSIWEIEYQD